MHHHLLPQIPQHSHPISRIDARVKLLTTLALLVMVISCQGIAFPSLVSGICLFLCLTLGITVRTLALRFSEPLFIAATVTLLKLFFSGSHPLFSVDLGFIHLVGHREGLMDGARVASRIVGGASLLAVVGFSTPFTELVAALSWLRVPRALIEIALFAWRYLFLLFEDAQVVYNAQRNRLGYVGYRRRLASFGTLAGVLVIKAFDNSQSITTAMVQRGYDGQMPLLFHKPLQMAEVLCAVLFVAGMAMIRVM